jgi:hypothetical protein
MYISPKGLMLTSNKNITVSIYTILVYTDNVPMTFMTKRVHLNQGKILLNIRKLICVYMYLLLLLLLLLLKCITFYFLNLCIFYSLIDQI